jgi:hypothetical protein
VVKDGKKEEDVGEVREKDDRELVCVLVRLMYSIYVSFSFSDTTTRVIDIK